MCDPSYAVGIGCLELEQVQQTPRRIVIIRNSFGLDNLHICRSQLLFREVDKVIASELRKQILRLQSGVAHQSASRQTRACPKSLSLPTLISRHAVLRTTQAPKPVPILHFELM